MAKQREQEQTEATVTSAMRQSPEFLRHSVELSQGVALGRYLVVRILGSGGMGRVYLAYDPQLDRRVAVKLLRGSRQDPAHRTRFIREAQAMARLSHPNVVSVLDVGSVGDKDFVAMEYVKGETLSAWLKRTSRPWPEVLSRFLAAGRGLAAAHDAGVVHRDFKPSNVLVGHDGRVRVTDFGIARMVAPGLDRGSAIFDAVALGGPEGIIGNAVCSKDRSGDDKAQVDKAEPSITGRGAVLGTPKYMAPEQHAGTIPDPRTDQFSFCVALYEALYREHPFAGKTSAKLPEIAAPSNNPRRVPLGVRKALLRGLSSDRRQRYPTMGELMTELEEVPQRRRRTRLAALAATLVAAAILGLILFIATRSEQHCANAKRELDGVWDSDVKLALRQAFVASPTPHAEDTFTRVEKTLDDHGRRWTEMRTEACASTRLDSHQSTRAVNLRVDCLDYKRERLRALVEVLRQADAIVVANALSAVSELEVESCANLAALPLRVKPPAESSRPRVDSVRAQLARVDALRQAGKLDQALALATEALASARELDYRPLTGQAALALGRVHTELEHGAAAESSLRDAAWAAEASGDDATAADAWTALVYVLRANHSDCRQAAEAARHADAVVTRLGDDRRRAALLDELGGLSVQRGRFSRAVVHFEQAIELTQRSGGNQHRVANTLVALSSARAHLGSHHEAVAALERALAIRQDNPAASGKMAATRFLLARALWQADDQRRAGAMAEIARATYAGSGDRFADKLAEVELWQETHVFPVTATAE